MRRTPRILNPIDLGDGNRLGTYRWLLLSVVCVFLSANPALAQISRTKQQDRTDYRSSRRAPAAAENDRGAESPSAVNLRPLSRNDQDRALPMHDVSDYLAPAGNTASKAVIALDGLKPVRLGQEFDTETLDRPIRLAADQEPQSGRRPIRHVSHEQQSASEPVILGSGVDQVAFLGDFGNSCGCDGMGCDAVGCDAMGCGVGGCDGMPSFGCNTGVSLDPCQWFGSVELMLMFRKGDVPPPLVTTGPGTDADTAGELGQAGTSVLSGGQKIFDEMTVGGRLTLGTWLDSQRCRSLVFRGWFAGDQDYEFSANQNTHSVLARPFLDVSDNLPTPAQETQLIVFPSRSSGSVSVSGDSEVYGADIQIRQPWWRDMGANIDVLYGYQYMQMNEGLRIGSSSTSLDNDFAPLGSVIDVTDSFHAENEFHGGQLGLASRYREGCWSFDGLIKVGFGRLSRRAIRSGRTTTRVDVATATINEGLLVRDTNSGTMTDNTFGWIPELDLSLGWHQYRNFDITCGYHLVVMGDALQTSGMIDPNLAVNLSSPATGQQSPSAAVSYDTFYLHGIHFGLKYVY